MATLQSELSNIATQTAAAGGPTLVIPTLISGQPTSTPVPSEAVETPSPEPSQPTATPVVVYTATPGIPSTYQLQKGEFPFCIARRFNVNQYELLNLNGLTLSSKPVVGFTLKIPQTGNPFSGQRALRPHPTTHTVSAGETIYSIACLYGDVDPSAIVQANGLSAPYTLTAGQSLYIP
jgi:LysM repeat protein